MQNKIIDYLSKQLRSDQWGFFLRVFFLEMSARHSPQELRILMRSAGMAAGSDMPLPECNSIEQMQVAANELWAELGWGFVNFEEHSAYLSIQHFCSPLQATLSTQGQGWMEGFLEGVYQQWFALLGASRELQVAQVGDVDEYGTVTYKLGR